MSDTFDAKKALRFLSKADPRLGQYIKRVGPFSLEHDLKATPFNALARSIVYQQLSGKAASSIYSKVKGLYPGRKALDPELILNTPDEVLRSAGLSRAKILAVKDLSLKTLEGIVPSRREIIKLSNEEIIERLTQVRGIGPWTVEMLLIFYLGRMDVLPATDYGVRKGFALVYKKKELPHPKKLLEYGELWKPYRSVAAWYLWRVLDL